MYPKPLRFTTTFYESTVPTSTNNECNKCKNTYHKDEVHVVTENIRKNYISCKGGENEFMLNKNGGKLRKTYSTIIPKVLKIEASKNVYIRKMLLASFQSVVNYGWEYIQ